MIKNFPIENGVLLEDIVKKTNEALDRKDYFQALLFQVASIEATLRNRLFEAAHKRSSAENFCYGYQTKYSLLIDGLNLLGGEEELEKDLREYGKKRNKIIHAILQFSSYQELNNSAEEGLKLGSKIYNVLRTPPNRCMKKPPRVGTGKAQA